MANEWTSRYVEKEAQGNRISNWKKLRESYKPENISLLLVGEAPPHPSSGKFFYEGNPFTECTKIAFQRAFSDMPSGINNGYFLNHFKSLGCYFDYLSLEPVAKRDAFQRNYALLQYLSEFIERLKDSPPKAVVVVMKRIDYLVRYALDEAGLDSVNVTVLKHPSRSKKSIDEYMNELREILIKEREKGIFPKIDFAEQGMRDDVAEKRSATRKMADRSHRVEVRLPGIPAYQFKVKDLSPEGACLLIREDSQIVGNLDVDQELDLKYYGKDKQTPEITFKAQIKHMTKADVPPFQGHFLVGLMISNNGQKNELKRRVRK